MSIASRINIMKSHIEDIYDTLEIAGTDLTNLNKNIANIESEIENNLKNYLADGIDSLWNNCEKVTANDVTTATLNNTIPAKMNINLKGNSSQADTPTPDSPVPIKVVTGNVTYKQCGKNMFNFQDTTKYMPTTKTILSALPTGIRATQRTSGTYSSAYFLIENYEYLKGKELKIVATITSSASNNGDIRIYGYTSGTLGERITITDGVFTIPADFNYAKIAILFYSNTNGTGNVDDYVDYTNLRVIINSTNDSYEPYYEEAITLPLGNIELAKIGDYTDRIFKAVSSGNPLKPSYYDTLPDSIKETLTLGKWYKQGIIGKVILDGTEDWQRNDSQTLTDTCYFSTNAIDNVAFQNDTNIMSNYFLKKTLWNLDEEGIQKAINTRMIRIRLDKSAANSVNTFKTWLSTHNTTVYYVLATPTMTEITDETLIENLNNLETIKSNNGITNIFQENYNLPFYLDVTAIKNF